LRIVYISTALLFSLMLLLSSFELTLFFFHSPFGSTIIEPQAHSITWIYLLKQKYISFIDLDIFNIYEKRHLLDVKRLFEKIYSLWIIISAISLSLLLFFYLRSREKFFLILRYSSIVGSITTLIYLLILFNFLENFTYLHQLIFPHYSWIFPPNSILIEWFPLSYFQEFAIIMVLIYLGLFFFIFYIHIIIFIPNIRKVNPF
jgi:uncharacterized membrane protein